MQRLTPPLPSLDDAALRAVLRDGSVVTLKIAEPADRDAVRRFFHDLSPESRRRRFFAIAEPSDALVARLCDASRPAEAATLLCLRQVGGEVRPIAIGSYIGEGGSAAEVAFAVADAFQGKGLGTVLLERLAGMAAAYGVRRFDATTLPENAQMLEVFYESGFEIRSKTEAGTIAVQLSLDPTSDTIASAERRMGMATAASLRPLLEPASVAVVGASRDPRSIGRRILRALTSNGFTGSIYPINPKADELDGLRCYARLADIPARVDLAVVAVPHARVLDVVDECAAAEIKSLVVITAGYAEAGAEGRARQQALVDKVRAYGMRMIGPNCMGVLNADPALRLNASFSPIVPPSGSVALSSQSGALGMAIIELATERGVGLSTFVSVGNKADVSGNDLLQYWEADPHTSVILLYLESFGNPRRFGRLARRIARSKPIVCVKAGRTRAGLRAAGSHTAALAASDTAVDALFRQSGVIRAETLDEMFDIAACLEAQPLPPGRRVAIVTNAGGPGILAVDACEAAGLKVVEFSAETREQLAAFLPAEAAIGNPVDMVASAGPDEYRRALEIVLTAPDIDALIVIYTPVDQEHAAATLTAIQEGLAAGRRAGATAKPILACVMAGSGRPKPLVIGDGVGTESTPSPTNTNGHQQPARSTTDAIGDGVGTESTPSLLRPRDEHVPAYGFPENAARALGKVATYADWRAQAPGLLWTFEDIKADDARDVCRRAIDRHGDGWLSGEDTRAVLGAFGLPLAAGTIARSADEAAALAQVIGFPVAAKLAARRLPHKSDLGAVRLDLTSDAAVRRAFDDIMARGLAFAPADEIDGVLIQAMIAGGVETMIGVSEDRLFGPLVAFGLGGVHVEILGDVQFRVAPLTDRDVDELLHGIRGLPLLRGYRGHAPADLDGLRDLLLRVSRLAVEVPEMSELDLNPVIALSPGQGCRIVDARVHVRRI
ncbi:MAG TPA: GNAT family N-acetyltransferase [Vicinamibacterales bacterium]|nr:GNAT family N-acetyltransferase [Vicinamibacterales bacterium]